jgi:diguanylate cyclase (GGDEF)-like protein
MHLARVMIVAYTVLLFVYALVSLAMVISGRATADMRSGLTLGGLGILAAIGMLALMMIRRRNIIGAGYLLAGALLAASGASLQLFPEPATAAAPGFVFSIMAAGAVIGGPATYLFAAASTLLLGTAWLSSTQGSLQVPGVTTSFADWAFLIGQIGTYFGLAAILHNLSSSIDSTVGRLRGQTDLMTQLANTDALTELANRRFLFEQMGNEFARARRYRRPLSLLYLDLDGFKAVNDRFGHMYGDEILRGVARSMRGVLRSTDLLARIGGDEFAVLLPETTIEGAINVAAKLRKALAAYSHQLSHRLAPLSFSAGISQMLPDDSSIDDILARADQAQYRAKNNGKAYICTQDELEAGADTADA